MVNNFQLNETDHFMKKAFSLIFAIGALILFCFQLYGFIVNPITHVVAEASMEEVNYQLDKLLLEIADEKTIEAKLNEALAQTPRKWETIELYLDYIAEQNYMISEETLQLAESLKDDDSGFWQSSVQCFECMHSPETCPMNWAQSCNIAVEFTPVGDVRSLYGEYDNWSNDREIDQLNVGLSVLGLGATVAAVGTMGGSLAIKGGAAFLKTAKNAKKLNPRMIKFLNESSTGLIDFSKVPSNWMTSPSSLNRAIDPDKMATLSKFAENLYDVQNIAGIPRTLKYLDRIDHAHDAEKLARLTKMSKTKPFVAMELTSKGRLFKIFNKYGKKLTGLVISAITLLMSILGLFLSFTSYGVSFVRRVMKLFTRSPKVT